MQDETLKLKPLREWDLGPPPCATKSTLGALALLMSSTKLVLRAMNTELKVNRPSTSKTYNS